METKFLDDLFFTESESVMKKKKIKETRPYLRKLEIVFHKVYKRYSNLVYTPTIVSTLSEVRRRGVGTSTKGTIKIPMSYVTTIITWKFSG